MSNHTSHCYRTCIFIFCLSFFFLCSHNLHFCCQAQPTTSTQTYEWEDWDYYQLLGLKQNASLQDIKKSYRQEAKRWHPDKTLGQTNATKQESNARFARIAEAYQVLSDDEKRNEYDALLKQQGVEQNYFSWGDFDPFRMFEEFFRDDSNEARWDDFDEATFYGTTQPASHYDHPMRVNQEEMVWIDNRGQEILRILQTEDYADRYYRILAQDFVEDWDRFQRTWVYHPLQPQPFIVEEGYREQQRQRTARSTASNILWPGSFLTPDMAPLQQGHYQAGVLPTCELRIVDDDTVIWTSDTSTMMRYAPDCRLELRGPHLALIAGYPDQILWYSEAEDDEHVFDASYLARLDSDGSLAVYRTEPLEDSSWRSRILGRPPRTRAARVFQSFVRLVGNIVLDPSPLRLICVSTTGPFGCLRIGRLAVRIFRGVLHVFRKLDRFFEDFL